jgi:cation transport ATPase
MHCASCDILVKDKCNEVKNVEKVEADYHTATAKITYTGELDTDALNKKIREYGYEITDEEHVQKEPLFKRITDASILGFIIIFLYFLASELHIIPTFSGTVQLTLGTAFLLGLVASTSTCMATSGALFMATIGKVGNIRAAVGFNVGRVLSYGAFGFIFGLLGKSLSANSQIESFLTLFVAVAMIFVGLDMLNIFSFTSFMPQSFTKGLFQKLEHRFLKNPSRTSFLLGAITYLLPCGFTQTVQFSLI